MARKSSSDWNGCPIRYGAAVFGDPWSLVILRDLIFKGARYYGDLLKNEEGISTNILASRLESLEQEGLVHRRQDPANKTRVIYSLTEKSIDLVPVLMEMIKWSAKWDGKTEVPPSILSEIQTDPEGYIRRQTEQLHQFHG